ncbi:MAG: 4-(cytidine 5'-diphospho)-2-C-methyl-D-erythritol kinase [Prolixibacteraceae bacterium]
MVLFPNAKINIGLNILRKREDGYHDLESLFYPIGLKDALEFVENGKNIVNFNSSGIALDIPPEKNIVLKAYRLLQEEHSLPGLDFHLHKVIPFGAGLGGGSSDAAFLLKSLNEHFELEISAIKLKHLAGRLGADCSFFLENTPCHATGKGEILTPVDFSLKGSHLLLVKPPFGVETKSAYAGVVPAEFPFDFMKIILGPVSDWQGMIRNDFEASVFSKYPESGEIKARLTGMGATYASMSGSGSSVYGLFEKEPSYKETDFPLGSFFWKEELI